MQTSKNELLEIKETEESAMIAAALGKLRAQSGADFFNASLPPNHPARVTRQTVWNWLNGIYKPSDKVLLAWRIFYKHDDVRYQLAVDILKMRESQVAAHWVGSVTEPLKVKVAEVPA